MLDTYGVYGVYIYANFNVIYAILSLYYVAVSILLILDMNNGVRHHINL